MLAPWTGPISRAGYCYSAICQVIYDSEILAARAGGRPAAPGGERAFDAAQPLNPSCLPAGHQEGRQAPLLP
ncbi:unnamed protein product [Rangifer tarandus platyrhynchus]|uniref:Uncharacterized protein n=1 Tax=Rangifer tarandus platyrhynchus TaxID=3082113 RepID=A0ABN8ZBY3_RANTA|nr:unnamed protein product [Rangifer tarandus platyrhynchus]